MATVTCLRNPNIGRGAQGNGHLKDGVSNPYVDPDLVSNDDRVFE
ncbi:MAG: hypothetical protein ABI472_14230 [Ginsengibacter sp.]